MLRITFYPDDVAAVQGFHFKDGARVETNREVDHQTANLIALVLTEQNKAGTIEATIIVERKPVTYELPKIERVNSIFGAV